VGSSPLLESTLGLFFQLVFYYIVRKFLRIFFRYIYAFFHGYFLRIFCRWKCWKFCWWKIEKICYNFIFISDLRNVFF